MGLRAACGTYPRDRNPAARCPASGSAGQERAAMTRAADDARQLRRVERRMRKIIATDAGMRRFLDDLLGPENYTYDPSQDVWPNFPTASQNILINQLLGRPVLI